MRKYLFFIYITLSLLPFSAMAQSSEGINSILNNILSASTVLIQILITLAILAFGWGVVKLIFAASNPQQIKDAKGILLWGHDWHLCPLKPLWHYHFYQNIRRRTG